jgi:hypothetical protein
MVIPGIPKKGCLYLLCETLTAYALYQRLNFWNLKVIEVLRFTFFWQPV